MSSFERRLQRYAFLTLPVVAIVVLLIFGALPAESGPIAVVLASLPLIWAWGPYQAHLGLNAGLDEVERQRWRVAFYLVPPSMALYWFLHVRGESAID